VNALAWSAAAAAAMAWPTSDRDARLRSLSTAGRLLTTPSPRSDRWRAGRARWVLVILGAGGVIALIIYSRSPRAGIACGSASVIALATLTHLVRRASADRAARTRRDDLHLMLDVLVAELVAGTSPEHAVIAAGRATPVFADPLASIADGAEPSRPLRAVAAGWSFALITGAPLAEVLARVRDDVDADRGLDRTVRSAVAGAQSSAALLAALPLFGIALGTAMGTHPFLILTGTPVGHVLLVTGVALDALGVIWTSAMIRRARAARST
jgi:tight adherence protein B